MLKMNKFELFYTREFVIVLKEFWDEVCGGNDTRRQRKK